jgi:hypothetical protein
MPRRTVSATPGSSHRADRVERHAGRNFDVRQGCRELAALSLRSQSYRASRYSNRRDDPRSHNPRASYPTRQRRH